MQKKEELLKVNKRTDIPITWWAECDNYDREKRKR